MSDQKKITREHVDQLKREFAEMDERAVRLDADFAESARIVDRQALKDFDQNAWRRIKAYAERHGVSLDEAYEAVVHEEMAEVGDPDRHLVDGEDAAMNAAARRLAEDRGVDYDTALSHILSQREG